VLARLHLPDLLSLRATSAALRRAIRTLPARTLRAGPGGELPARAWSLCPLADGLLVGCPAAGPGGAARQLAQLLDTLGGAPGRLQRVYIRSAARAEERCARALLQCLAHRQRAAPCACAECARRRRPPLPRGGGAAAPAPAAAGSLPLKALHLDMPLSPELAEELPEWFPSLEELSLSVRLSADGGSDCRGGARVSWQPAYTLDCFQHLRRLRLRVDLAPLAACAATLEELELGRACSEALAAPPEVELLGLGALAGMPRLRRLLLPAGCSVAGGGDGAAWWRVLGPLGAAAAAAGAAGAGAEVVVL
jgi:hypothetical protein